MDGFQPLRERQSKIFKTCGFVRTAIAFKRSISAQEIRAATVRKRKS